VGRRPGNFGPLLGANRRRDGRPDQGFGWCFRVDVSGFGGVLEGGCSVWTDFGGVFEVLWRGLGGALECFRGVFEGVSRGFRGGKCQ